MGYFIKERYAIFQIYKGSPWYRKGPSADCGKPVTADGRNFVFWKRSEVMRLSEQMENRNPFSLTNSEIIFLRQAGKPPKLGIIKYYDIFGAMRHKMIIGLLIAFFAQHASAQLGQDKVYHFLGGNLFGLAGAGLASELSDGNRGWTFAGSVGGSLLIGLAKEAIDERQYGGWDNDDLLATVLGALP